MSTWELGVASFFGLGNTFLASVFGTKDPGIQPGEAICQYQNTGLTSFYYDPFEDHPCAGIDWIIIFLAWIPVHIVNWSSRYFLWEPLGMYLSNGRFDVSTRKKFAHSMYSASFFIASGIFAYRILTDKYWIFSREGWCENLPLPTVERDFKFYFLLYIGRFISDFIGVFSEERLPEAFMATVIHHTTTIALAFLSSHGGFSRIGGMVMYFFDWADPPLLFAKSCRYLTQDPKDMYQQTANRLFEIFAVIFIVTRNIMFNYVTYAAFVDFPNHLTSFLCKICLFILVVLQTYWLNLIIKAATNLKKDGTVDDVREQDKKSSKETD